MRILFVLCHYFGPKWDGQPEAIYSSQLDPLARIAAVNASIVGLYRHFGPHRHGRDPSMRLPEDRTPERVSDIIVLQVPKRGLLDAIGIDPSCYTVEYFDGPPQMLCFEAQRVLRERLGGYDYYAVIEDDMVIHDPLFFDKLACFERSFGTEKLLQPTCYEMAQSGRPAMVVTDPILSADVLAPFRRPTQKDRLVLHWHDREQSFVLPQNPHARGYFLSNAQLQYWIGTPWFYDRDTSWGPPIECAMCYSQGRAFDLYKPGMPDPFFLSIEHYGTRYARAAAPDGVIYGDTPLLEIAHDALQRANAGADGNAEKNADSLIERGGGGSDLFTKSSASFNTLVQERDALLFELIALKKSRSRLFKQLMSMLVGKGLRW